MNLAFPRIITEERKKRKISQKQAAADLGISQALLSHYEKGIRECGLDFVVKIADYYNISCDLVLGHLDEGEGENTPSVPTADLEAVKNNAASLLSACEAKGGMELEKEMLTFIMLNFYKLLRMLYTTEDRKQSDIFSIPCIPAENLTDSALMNVCASIKLKSSRGKGEECDECALAEKFRDLIRMSESKISEFNTVLP